MKKYSGCKQKGFYRCLMAIFLLGATQACGSEPANVKFGGTLVALPCIIADDPDNMDINFGTIIDKNIYSDGRSSTRPVVLELAECDLSMGQKTVSVSFNGIPNPHLPGLISLDASSAAAGIAIGLETPEGTLLPIGKDSSKYVLLAGSNRIMFRAFVQGEPDAIKNRALARGEFSAIATFSLNYE